MSNSVNYLTLALIVLSLVGRPGYGQFANKVAETPHNLLKVTKGSMAELGLKNYGDICVYCHIPHEANSPLQTKMWNRILPTAPYQMYENPIKNKAITGTPDSISLICLSCHDGTMPLDAIKQAPQGYPKGESSRVTISACSNTCHSRSNPSGDLVFAGGKIGADLRKHHPIAIRYDAVRNSNLQPAGSRTVNGLPLYGSDSRVVGCATCHDPHDNSQRPFLRISNSNGELCQVCHKI